MQLNFHSITRRLAARAQSIKLARIWGHHFSFSFRDKTQGVVCFQSCRPCVTTHRVTRLRGRIRVHSLLSTKSTPSTGSLERLVRPIFGLLSSDSDHLHTLTIVEGEEMKDRKRRARVIAPISNGEKKKPQK